MYLHQENLPWDRLTNSSKKRGLFSSDFYFELSYEAANLVLGAKAADALHNHTLLMVKPEALIFLKIPLLLQMLQESQFELTYYCIKTISHVQISELWKYAWSAASKIRIVVNQAYYPSHSCVLLVLRNTACLPQSACDFLTDLKGSTPRGAYQPQHIRYQLQSINTFMNYVHTPDDSADVLRELGVFFGWDELTDIYNNMKSGNHIPFAKLLQKLPAYPSIAEQPEPKLLLYEFVQELQNKKMTSNIIQSWQEVLAGKQKITLALLEQLRENHLLEWTWQFVTIVTSYMEYSTPYPPLL